MLWELQILFQKVKKDIPNNIRSLSDENHFYYQNVLKNNKSSRDQVINTYWILLHIIKLYLIMKLKEI